MKNLYAALLKFQDEVDPVLKDATNPHFKSKYATLTACIEGTKPHLSRNGLVVIPRTKFVDGIVILVTKVVHTPSGEELDSEWPLLPVKQDPQRLGSACTYGRRYSYLTALNLGVDDDDANAASHKAVAKQQTENLNRVLQQQAPKQSAPPQQEEIPLPEEPGFDTFDDIAPEHRALDESAGEYEVKFGKFAKNGPKKIRDIPELEGISYIAWLENNAKQKGKKSLEGEAAEFARHFEAWLKRVPVSQIPLRA